ncbi:iron-containing redox enzyme family protein [uncultured Jatrophihabitans sp.]|uniref:iron-containing redox enzyme family protein n=1 Tax=uncultured Jatrophihabitans sp. TaxID=1610747 RepID=UPI0035CAFF8D
MLLPEPRGPLTQALVDALRRPDLSLLPAVSGLRMPADPIGDDDLQLALWICFELHYRGFDDVAETMEWAPPVIAVRRALEEQLLAALRRESFVPPSQAPVAERLRALVDGDDGPSVARFVQTKATLAQFTEFAAQRSVYQLKEADPHTWAVPRLSGRAKAALVEIQIDEYGRGDETRMHYELYRGLLRGLGLSDAYGAYVDAVPGITLAISNVMSMFGLRRDLRGALVGHLAAYEMTSSAPCRRYAKGLRRLGGDDEMCRFYDEHVTADALHEQLAAHDLCGGLAEAEPQLIEDIVFGAAACLHVDNRFAEHVLGAWQRGRSSLRKPDAVGASALLAAVGV